MNAQTPCPECARPMAEHGAYQGTRCTFRDLSGLNPQLLGLENARVEVTTTYGETRRFYVGKSTGWQPCHLEIKLRTSSGGGAAESKYDSVRVIRRNAR